MFAFRIIKINPPICRNLTLQLLFLAKIEVEHHVLILTSIMTLLQRVLLNAIKIPLLEYLVN
jgi:hypothetical protein